MSCAMKYTAAVCTLTLTVVVLVSGAPTDKFKCPRPNGFFPHPVYCEQYVYCYKNVPKPETCPPGEFFNSEIRRCKNASQTDCGSRIKSHFETEGTTKASETEGVEETKAISPVTQTSLKPNSITEIPPETEVENDVKINGTQGEEETNETTPGENDQDGNGSDTNDESGQDGGVHTTPSNDESKEEDKSGNGGGSNEDGSKGQDGDNDSLNFECKVPYGVFPHPTNPRQFIHCSLYIAYVKDCPAMLEFNAELETCAFPLPSHSNNAKWKSNPLTEKRAEAEVEDHVKVNSVHEDEEEQHVTTGTEKYEDGNVNDAKENGGNDGKSSGEEEKQDGVTSDDASKEQGKEGGQDGDNNSKQDDKDSLNFECKVRHGVFPHPTNPRQFIHCSHYVPYVKDCPAGLHFSAQLRICVFPF